MNTVKIGHFCEKMDTLQQYPGYENVTHLMIHVPRETVRSSPKTVRLLRLCKCWYKYRKFLTLTLAQD